MCSTQNSLATILSDLHKQSLITFPIQLSETADGKKKLIPPTNWVSFTGTVALKPHDNAYCILTGDLTNLLVVDWDLNKSALTRALYENIISKHGLPNTFIVQSANGGYHWYFKPPPGHKIGSFSGMTIKDTLYDVDVRCNGGMIVGPGSHYNTVKLKRKEYKFYNGTTPSDISYAPDWLYQELPILNRTTNKANPTKTKKTKTKDISQDVISGNLVEVPTQDSGIRKTNPTNVISKDISQGVISGNLVEVPTKDSDKTKYEKPSLETTKNLLDCLKVERCNLYDSWRDVCFALHSAYFDTDEEDDALNLFVDWSKTSDKFEDRDKDDDESKGVASCIKLWNDCNGSNTGGDSLSIGSLFAWAKQDNPKLYHEYQISPVLKPIDVPILFTPDRTIECNKLPLTFWGDLLDSHDFLAVQSNMNTGKTYALAPHFPKFKRIVIVYFRVSLNVAIYESLKKYDFTLYSELQGPIDTDKYPRVIVQIDSLHRLEGAVDLVVLDEIESTLAHMMTKKSYDNDYAERMNQTSVKKMWDPLKSYIKHSPKVILCDATLQDTTVDSLLELRKKDSNTRCIKVQNTYHSYSHNKVKLHIKKRVSAVPHIIRLLSEGKRLVVPTNAQQEAEKLYITLTKRFPEKSICLIDRNFKGDVTPSSWVNYDCLIYTPTIAAGISFEQSHFHTLVAIFTNLSCDVEMCLQMLARCRKLIDDEMHIYVPTQTPTSIEKLDVEIDEKIYQKVKTGSSYLDTSLLVMDPSQRSLDTSEVFYKLFKHTYRKKMITKCAFVPYLKQVLGMHGMIATEERGEVIAHVDESKVEESKVEEREELPKADESKVDETKVGEPRNKSLAEWKKELKDDWTEHKGIEANLILTARPANEGAPITKYDVIRQKLESTFDVDLSTKNEEYVEQNLKYLKQYQKYNKLAQNIDEETLSEMIIRLRDTFRKQYSKAVSESEIGNQVHKICYDTFPLKTIHALEFLKYAGFSTIKVNAEQKEIKWDELVKYCRENEGDIRAAFECEKKKKFEGEVEELKQSVIQYINPKLQSVYGVKFKRLNVKSQKYYVDACFHI